MVRKEGVEGEVLSLNRQFNILSAGIAAAVIVFIVVAFLPEGEKHPMDIKVERIFEIADSAVVPEVGYDYEGPGREEWFDPNSYFRVLEHLSIRSGYTIDYVYRAYPVYFVPYIKPLKTRPLNSIAEVMAFMKEDTLFSDTHSPLFWVDTSKEWIGYVDVDDTEGSYVELMILYFIGDPYSMYEEFRRIPVFSKSGLRDVVRREERDAFVTLSALMRGVNRLKNFSFEPQTVFKGDTAIVRCCFLSKWDGLNEGRYWISRSIPHVILKEETKNIVKSNLNPPFH